MPFDVFDHDDGVVDHQTHGQDDCQQREQVHGKAEDLHQEDGAHQRNRDCHHRHQDRTQRSEEQEDDHDHDQDRLEERSGHLVDGVVDIVGGIERDGRPHAARQVASKLLDLLAHVSNDVQGVGVGQHPDAHEHLLLSRHPNVLVVGVSAQDDIGDVLEANQRALMLAYHQAFELLDRGQIGGRGQIDLNQPALGLAHRRKRIVGCQRLADVRRAHSERRHAFRLQPGTDGEGLPAQDLGTLNAIDGGEAWLDDPNQVIGDLVLFENIGAEAEVHGGNARIRRLDRNGWNLRLRWQIRTHLIDSSADVGKRIGGRVVQLEPDLYGGKALGTLRLDEVDAIGGRNGALERGGNEAAHQIGIGAHVSGAHHYGCALDLGVLSHVETANCLQPGDDDYQVDDHRQHGPSNEQLGKFHRALGETYPFSGWGCSSGVSCTLLLTATAAPLRSLKAPAVTTV